MFNQKIRLCQKENLKDSQITMILMLGLKLPNKNNSDLNKNGKWKVSFKEIQVI